MKKMVISISYGNYTKGVGGTDKFILTQQNIFLKKDTTFFHIFPVNRINKYIQIKNSNVWGLTVDGKYKGMFSTNQINKKILHYVNKKNADLKCIYLHHLKDINLFEIDKILEFCNIPIYFYLHDYMTICPAKGLINSNNVFCGSSFPNESKCIKCSYYNKNTVIRKNQIVKLLNKYSKNITFIAPSMAAKNVWCKTYPNFSDNVIVINHQTLFGKYDGNNEIINPNEPIRIAFVGYQSNIKGWNEWEKAVKKAYSNNRNEKFYQFGTVNDHIDFVEEVEVDFKKNLNAMTDALRNKNIHCAVLWSIWPETYSYTYYEALSSNTFILTNSLSGNICDQVHIRKNGFVADNPNDLESLLDDEENLRKMINNYRINQEIKIPLSLKENEEIIDKSLAILSKNDFLRELKKEKKYTNLKILLYNLIEKITNIIRKR